ncbi:uncharacterized protein BO80DRAFT_456775 [Aspergillus ibericus CBS 121593]|uniref:Luciferase domain-containing protein n=1 Tax=Aspergillus ibericus CBS 121593 TaxID=1448316 RepID=A0A395GVN2_9EURO|nr:hypothetical protein BO80DRAFT_456775 [Aspergillus ibericus CBS 121593]RAK99204.1 hypothetical protein BO80DRAFT_456775 [Aspergillus ibericus CBS 121593]
MTSTAIYERRIAAGETTSFMTEDIDTLLGNLKRERATVGPHYVPILDTSFYALATRNSDIIKLAESKLELHANAIFLATESLVHRTDTTRRLQGECVHIHRLKDYSLHMVLSAVDCKKVFDAGWGQRHAFSGVTIPKVLTGGRGIDLPSEYVLIYAPRTEEEVTLVMGLIMASVRYLSGAEVQ